ncbi:MAG: ABC transporter ATP-binding protein/permease [Treponema sp.]|nr:ABC transporter ATP-binding protein/permease [Treponema sp.]
MKQRSYSFFTVTRRLLLMQIQALPLSNITQVIMHVLHGFSFALSVIVSRTFFEAITGAAAGQVDFMGVLFPLLLLSAATLGQQIMNGADNFHWMVITRKTEGKLRAYLHRKISALDPLLFEDPSFLDDLNKAKEGVGVIPSYCSIFLAIIFFYGSYFISIGAFLFSLKPILLLTLLLSFIPALLAQYVRGQVFTALEEANAPLRRENEYYQRTLCDREYFKETRTLGAFTYFFRLFTETLDLLIHRTWKAQSKSTRWQLLLNTSTFAGMAASAYLLFLATMSGEISVGAFAAVFSALSAIFYIMQEIVSYRLRDANQNLGKVTNFLKVLDREERFPLSSHEEAAHKDPGGGDFAAQGIVAEQVSFQYPGREEKAVQDLSLTIAPGETLAIVGENGAGKSTLVRLLTGLYRPSSGRVLCGGHDTNGSSGGFSFRGISGVFQKYQRYKMDLRDNVFLSEASGEPTDGEITKALDEAGLSLEPGRLDLDTMLSPEFDGIDLSGGQWQRVAIGRGLYRANGFIVLDEPTAAIDPIEESRIYTQFQALARGKCALVVTHRLGSARLADRIIVMDGGRLVDQGSHEELLGRPGKYKEMWESQAQWYQRDASTELSL